VSLAHAGVATTASEMNVAAATAAVLFNVPLLNGWPAAICAWRSSCSEAHSCRADRTSAGRWFSNPRGNWTGRLQRQIDVEYRPAPIGSSAVRKFSDVVGLHAGRRTSRPSRRSRRHEFRDLQQEGADGAVGWRAHRGARASITSPMSNESATPLPTPVAQPAGEAPQCLGTGTSARFGWDVRRPGPSPVRSCGTRALRPG
jgi:hypothetical protein